MLREMSLEWPKNPPIAPTTHASSKKSRLLAQAMTARAEKYMVETTTTLTSRAHRSRVVTALTIRANREMTLAYRFVDTLLRYPATPKTAPSLA